MSAGLVSDQRAVRRPGRGWTHSAALLGYLVLTLVMTWPLAIHFTDAIPGDSFDGWQNYWNLWWMKVSLVERIHNPYATDLLYYPTGVTLYFHTLNPFNGLVSLPIQLAAGLIAAYNSIVLISWVLAGYGMFLLARWTIHRTALRLEGNGARLDSRDGDLAAFVAGAIFTFAPVHMAHLLGHMQVMALQWLPFYVLALLRGMERAQQGKRWLSDALLAGIFLALAGLCDWYFVLYLFLFTAILVSWAALRALFARTRSWRTLLAALAPALIAGGLFALLLAPLLVPMVLEATRYSFMVRPSTDLYIFSATLVDFLIPNRLHTLFRPESFTRWGNQIAPFSERTIAIGYAALALAIVAVVRLRRWAGWWAIAALVFLLLALGPRMHAFTITAADIPANMDATREGSLYALVNALVPFMRISRSVSRFAIMVQLCMAVLAGLGLAWWLSRLRLRDGAATLAMGFVVLGVVLAESWVAPFPLSSPDTPAYYQTLAGEADGGAILNLPMNYDRPGYLLYQTVHRRPLTVAYISRDDPRTLTERVPLLQHWRHLGPDIVDIDPVQVGATVLHDLGVGRVILDRYKMPGGEEREYTEALANALFAGIDPEYADERITVYQVPGPDVPQPYLELGPLHWGALVEEEDMRYRSVGEQGAEIVLRHAERGARLTIDYQSEAETVIEAADGNEWSLPVAPGGNAFTLELPPGVDRLTLRALSGETRVSRLSLEAVSPR